MSWQLGFSSDDSLNSTFGFIAGSASRSFQTLSSLHGSNADVDGAVTWRTIGSFTPNFFSILEQYLQLSVQGLLERASAFTCADPFCGEFPRHIPAVSVST
ncbi:hypothetical protein TNCV_5100861 [Trichonephila clavipes]|uniref:Uncharacterized protein n=1 Tax=Trichonephila clavipes TaxID=2585209 RepID=A0A8X6V2J1_TRICX|nr:hypothetical protein TNCV_5100861 [Trichonephila clavipes]